MSALKHLLLLFWVFKLASIEMSFDQVDNKMRADGDGFFNYFIMDLKSDGRHSKQVTPPKVATETNTNTKLL